MAAGTSGRGGVITDEHVLWYQWARITLAEAAASEAAQSRRTRAGNSDDSTAFGESVDRGLVAACSAAFSMEAMSRDLAPIAIDAQTLAAWKRNQTAAEDVLFETLKRCLDLTQDTVRALVNEFEPVIEKRGRAVHYKSVLESPVRWLMDRFRRRSCATLGSTAPATRSTLCAKSTPRSWTIPSPTLWRL